MTHRERHRWVQEISRINKKINKSAGSASSGSSSGFGGGFSIGASQGPIAGFNLTQPDDDD